METSTTSPAAVATIPPHNPHIFSRQLIGLVLWVGVISALAGPYFFTVCLTLATLTFLDAWKAGIYKRGDTRGFLNVSPMTWGIAMAFIFVVAFPVYVLHRRELRTIQSTNAFYWALVTVGATLIVTFVGTLILWM